MENTIRGGATGIFQVKEVGPGDNDLPLNDQKDAIQTGFIPGPNVRDFTVIVPIYNPFSSDANNGSLGPLDQLVFRWAMVASLTL